VVPLAVDTGMFRPAPKDPAILAELGCTGDDVIVLFTGRLLWVKGIIDLVQAASMLNSDDTCSHVKYLIVGDGPDRELMQKHIASCKLQNRFHFMHRVEYERMPAILNTADMVVVPSSISCSWEEQFGMVIAESMACAKPVITTNTGAIPEVVGDNAILVPCHAPTQIASAIRLLARSRETRKSLGDKGLAWARPRYSISATSRQMLQFLERVLLV
jgi:glycosyltransferase involved in cell wall biosynthesis